MQTRSVQFSVQFSHQVRQPEARERWKYDGFDSPRRENARNYDGFGSPRRVFSNPVRKDNPQMTAKISKEPIAAAAGAGAAADAAAAAAAAAAATTAHS